MYKHTFPGGFTVETDDPNYSPPPPIFGSNENVNPVKSQENNDDSEIDDDLNKDAFSELNSKVKINKAEAENILKNAKSKYKTMANTLVQAYKIKSSESYFSTEGRTISGGQKAILILLVLLTNVSIFPWLIVWWLTVNSNKNKFEQLKDLINIEMLSVIENYNKEKDDLLKQKLIKLFKSMYKEAVKRIKILRKIKDYKIHVDVLVLSENFRKETKFYKNIKFPNDNIGLKE
jgi:hypothetical protein